MLKVLLYGYTQNQISGRKIERMMTDSIRMKWLAHYEFVSYCTLNSFRVTPHTAALLQECFIQFRSQLVQMDLIENRAILFEPKHMDLNGIQKSMNLRTAMDVHCGLNVQKRKVIEIAKSI